MKHFVFIITIVFFISCSTKKENTSEVPKITFLTSYYEEFVNAAKHLDKRGKDSCRRKMWEYLFIRYFSKCENTQWFNENPSDTVRYSEELKDLSKMILLLKKNEDTIKARIEKAFANCYKYLPYGGVSVFINPSMMDEKTTIRMGGVTGFTPGSKLILLYIDPSIKNWEEQLEITLAHEFNHTYWIKYNNDLYQNTLLDFMVCEGKAEAFSHLVYPKTINSWDTSLTKVEKKKFWNEAKTKLETKDYEFQQEFMFGGKEYPYCTGYILGRDIVEAYLKKNTNIEPKNWTNFSPEFILKESGYK
jgi:uncharacterized protein YjaZ